MVEYQAEWLLEREDRPLGLFKPRPGLNPAQARQLLRAEVASIFALVLQNAGIFKLTKDGIDQFCGFMNALGFRDC